MYLLENLQAAKMDISTDWSNIRFGDAIGMAALAQALSFHYGKNVSFYHEPRFPTVEHIFKYTPGLLVKGKALSKAVNLQASCWAHWDFNSRYFDQHLYLRNPHTKEVSKNRNTVLINPIFDAPYNRDRNWSPDLFKKLVGWYLRHGWAVTVTGLENQIEQHLSQVQSNGVVRRVYNDVSKSMRAVCTHDVYIGGDTGMTHFASAMSEYPRRVIAIFGDGSPARHAKQCKDFVRRVDMSKCRDVKNNFTPKVNKHKQLLYTIQSNFAFENMTQFLLDTSTFRFKRQVMLDMIKTQELKGLKQQKKVLGFFNGNCDAIYDTARLAKSGYIVVPTLQDKMQIDFYLRKQSLDSAELKTCACSHKDFAKIFSRGKYRFDLLVDGGMDTNLAEFFSDFAKDSVGL